ncbi:helix-turn-helix domain-containing protein [Brevundimonas sp. R86498]|uniref:helix-turn-helix domain-containing protein n=1 Tax=Brevundimonas sp. R86498 TaxID=3093845 RepID=UPI0037CB8B83
MVDPYVGWSQLHLDWFSGVLIALGGQGLVLAVALSSSTANAHANRCLALALLVLVGMTSVYLFGWTGRAEVPPLVAFSPLNLPLALGPLLYGYVHGLARGRLPDRAGLHLLPAALLLAYLIAALLLPDDVRVVWKDQVHDKWLKPLIEAAVIASLTGYSLAGLRLLNRYRDWLAQARSDGDQYGALWVGGVLIVLLITLGLLTGVRFHTWFVGELDSGPFQIWLATVGAFIGVQGWRCSARGFPRMDVLLRAGDNASDWVALGQGWRDRTRAQGWWREPDLTLADLARRLGTNTGYLSRAINDGLGVNFNEMINRMRAQAVADRIDDGDVRPLIHIALEFGFSSKATFNRAFRAMHGRSPSAHRKAAQILN